MIAITSLPRALRLKRRHDALITIEDPGARKTLRFHRTPHPDQLVLKFEDVDAHDDGIAGPHEHHVEAAIRFAREHAGGSLLVHCHAGVCRSTAVGLAVMADRLGPGGEEEAVRRLRLSNPDAVPNLLVLRMADGFLERGGNLFDAWMAVERGCTRLAAYRDKKARLVRDARHMFAGRPDQGYYTAARCAPRSRSLSIGFAPPEGGVVPQGARTNAGPSS